MATGGFLSPLLFLLSSPLPRCAKAAQTREYVRRRPLCRSRHFFTPRGSSSENKEKEEIWTYGSHGAVITTTLSVDDPV